MDDLISRQAAIKAVGNLYAIHGSEGSWCDQREALEAIAQLPSAQPKPGKWIAVDSYSAFGGDEETWMAHGNPIAFYYCSECKEQTYAGENWESILSNYCPHCGAKMEGE